jgi:hypothetical protein
MDPRTTLLIVGENVWKSLRQSSATAPAAIARVRGAHVEDGFSGANDRRRRETTIIAVDNLPTTW